MRGAKTSESIPAPSPEISDAGRWSDFSQLVKTRLTALVLVTTGVGYYMATRGPLNLMGLFHVLCGSALAAAGASALNQWWERDLDALMLRTQTRPLPAGRMRPRSALILGSFLALAGIIYLCLTTTALAAILTAITVFVYLLGYTPMKRLSSSNTLVGAIPGAIPPLIGWAAVRGSIDFGAWTLFIILFFWQMPHFFAIAWLCRQDYDRAGFRMLSRDDANGGRSASQAVLFCILLLLLAGIPAFINMVHPLYLVAEIVLGSVFTMLAMRFHRETSVGNARRLFIGSLVYLPLLLAALMLSKQ